MLRRRALRLPRRNRRPQRTVLHPPHTLAQQPHDTLLLVHMHGPALECAACGPAGLGSFTQAHGLL